MIGPAGFMAAPKSDDEINEILAGMEAVYAEEVRRIEANAPRCHFTPMNLEYGDVDICETWWECTHCGHTK